MRTSSRRSWFGLALLWCVGGTPVEAQSGPVVRYAGAIDQDGCPSCCQFSCLLTPTPTPEVDALGRRVFRRTSGQFLLVVEAGPGTSNRQPGSEGVVSGGTEVPIAHASGRPSLQVQSQRKLGNGSAAIDCRTIPLGGVPGFPNLDFAATSAVTTGLIDMACRFEYFSASSVACTRNRYGDFAFLGSGSSRQYCFAVKNVDEFPDGVNVVAVQLRDVSGNLGPKKEFVVIVEPPSVTPSPSLTPTRTPTATPTPRMARVAGSVRYYANNNPVPNATLRVSGSAATSTNSSTSGAYQLLNSAPVTITVDARKLGDVGSPSAISTLDAAWVLQAVAGLRTFTTHQRLACDVTGNGSLSTLDASRILQRQVGLLDRFAVADQCNSDWLFDPLTTGSNPRRIAPAIGTGTCQNGALAYEPLSADKVAQDFAAILFGDCTGNWAASSGGSLLAQRPAVRLRVPRRPQSGMLRVPLVIDVDQPYHALDLSIRYRGEGLRPLRVRKLRGAEGAMLVSNLSEPGRVRLALASAQPIEPGGLLVIDFTTAEHADIRVEESLVE
ncbi:MAG: dockerin type I repeat-containing protein [Deltaproteobacteria bacterium]|nr:dockerin type I repeat-containing protein [Deltaproteobacteria bacterium]